MNKKGFTLIEVIVSLVIVSIVMVFMLSLLSKIKYNYDQIYERDNIEIYRSTLTRIINNDINDNDGIKSITISEDTMSCNITLNNDKTRKIEIYDVNTGKYTAEDNDKGIYEESKTLKYYDPTDNELIYMKTLTLTKYKDNDSDVIKSSEGYTFAGLLKDNVTINGKNLTLLTIRIYNGLNYEDRTNDIVISSY